MYTIYILTTYVWKKRTRWPFILCVNIIIISCCILWLVNATHSRLLRNILITNGYITHIKYKCCDANVLEKIKNRQYMCTVIRNINNSSISSSCRDYSFISHTKETLNPHGHRALRIQNYFKIEFLPIHCTRPVHYTLATRALMKIPHSKRTCVMMD